MWALAMSDSNLRAVLETLDPKAHVTLRRVLIHDQADRDAIASDLLRYRDGGGDDWANLIDRLSSTLSSAVDSSDSWGARSPVGIRRCPGTLSRWCPVPRTDSPSWDWSPGSLRAILRTVTRERAIGLAGAIVGLVASLILFQVVSMSSVVQIVLLVGVTVLGYIVASRMAA